MSSVVLIAAATFPMPDCNTATGWLLILPSKILQLAISVVFGSSIKPHKISTSCGIAPIIAILFAIVISLFLL